MKLKKLAISLVVGMFALTLVACGMLSSPQKEFIKELSTSVSEKYNAGKFEFKIEDITYDNQRDAALNMAIAQLKDMKLTGKFATDKKNNAFETEIILHALGEKLPIQVISKNDKGYISTSFVQGLFELMESFNIPIKISQKDLAKLQGKYIDLDDLDSASSAITKQEPKSNKTTKEKQQKKKYDEKLQKALQKTIESFDKKSFTEKDGILTHNFTKKEIIQLLETINETDKKEKDTKSVKQINRILKNFKKKDNNLDIKISINKKTKERKITFNFSGKQNDGNKASFVMSLDLMPLKNKKEINIPKKQEIIAEDELDEIVTNAIKTDNPTKKPAYKTKNDTLDDALEEVLEQIEDTPEAINEQTANQIRNSSKEYLNDEQMKRLNDALEKALKSNNI